MFEKSDSLSYHIFKDYNITFDEKGATCGTVRKVQWVRPGREPEEEKAKIEIRHITVNETGEKALKGYAFSTPEGPSELVVGLIGAGFGDTKEILRAVRKRDDFLEAANTINEDNDESSEGETFDMRDLLMGIESEDMEEDIEDVV